MATAAPELVEAGPALVDEVVLLVVLVALVALPATTPKLVEVVELNVWLENVVLRGMAATAEPEARMVPTTPRVVVNAVGVMRVAFFEAITTVAIAVAAVDVTVVVTAEDELDAAPPTIANSPE